MRFRFPAIAVCSGLAVFTLMWILISKSPLPEFETGLLQWIHGVRTDTLTSIAVWTTNTGSLNLLVPLAVLVSGMLFWRRRWLLGCLFLGTLLWYPLLLPLRIFIDRAPPKMELRSPTKGVVYIAEAPIERAGQRQAATPAPQAQQQQAPPPAPQVPWYDPLLQLLYRGLVRGFPSNHAAASGYFFGLCLILAWRKGWRAAAVVCALLIFGIGVSRVYMGVHYPSDVLASWGLVLAALGIAGAALCAAPLESRHE